MGSKQSSSNNLKQQKISRKLSQDYVTEALFSQEENFKTISVNHGLKRPLSNLQIKKLDIQTNCQGEKPVQQLHSFSNTSTCSEVSDCLSKKLSAGEVMSPFSISGSPSLSDLSEIKEADDKLQFENNKFKAEQISFTWDFTAEKVYLVLMRNEENMIKEKLSQRYNSFGQIQFYTTIDLEPGQYEYYFLVDGENRYCPHMDTMTINDDQIVNYIIIPEIIIGSTTTQATTSFDEMMNNNCNAANNNFNLQQFSSFSSTSWGSYNNDTYWTTTTTTTQTSTTQNNQRACAAAGRRGLMPPVPRAPCMKQLCCDSVKSKPKQAKRVHWQDDVVVHHDSVVDVSVRQ